MNDQVDSHVSEPTPSPPARDYSELGERIASVLNAAEHAAEKIRTEALRAAETLRLEAQAKAEAYAEERRREVDSESERRVAAALAGAESIRDTAQAAAKRIADEGQRRLGELRDEARALERRFESAIGDLGDSVAELGEVVLSAGTSSAAGAADGQSASEAYEPDLADALAPRYGDEAQTAAEVPGGEAEQRPSPAARPTPGAGD